MDAFNFDQLLVFVTSVDAGSFSGAARTLNRTQSAITYTIQKLENQVGTPLFDRGAYRPTLTSTGKALLPRARRIVADVNEFSSQAKGMVRGLEAEVRFGISEMVPLSQMTPAFAGFRAAFPTVPLRIVRGSFGLEEALVEGALDLAVLLERELPDVLDRNRISTMSLVAVAAPNHPLSGCKEPIAADHLRKQLQIVLTDPRELAGSPDYGVAALDSWRVTDLAAKRDLLCQGLGWGSMPEDIVSADVSEGRLVVLDIERWDGSDHLPRVDVVAAQSRERPPGLAGAALLAAIIQNGIGPISDCA